MLNNPYNSSAMVSSALPTLLTTVSQASFGPQQSAGVNQLAGLGGQQPMYQQPMYPQQQMYPQAMMMPAYGMPQYGQPGYPGGRVITTVTQTVNKTFIPAAAPMPMPYPGMQGLQMPFGSRWY